MRTIDFTPLFRSTIGFDRMQHLIDTASRASSSAESYPPYNIIALGEDGYRITMAVAGFTEDDLEVTAKENTLVISGRIAEDDAEKNYLYLGIATRAFERTFQLAEHVRVTGASLNNGMLNVDLALELPEEMKPRKIEIRAEPRSGTGAISHQAA